MQEVSVYLFLGFLDSGKTKFIQETLQDGRMDDGQSTLLLVCEEGEEEYEPKKFAVKKVAKVTLDGIDELTQENLANAAKKYGANRVIIEYNGTWELQALFDAMPENWVINQMMTFFDATTFLNYNANMRQLTFDKIQMTQLVVFNRFKKEFDKLAFHKAVRGISRRPDIVYEDINGNTEFDDIADPLPFDINADIIKIEDKDFAWFYRDMAENTKSYINKTVQFKGMAAVSKKMPKGSIVLGRHIMTCCEADIAYDGFAVVTNSLIENAISRDWFTVTAKITYGYSAVYKGKGPVLSATAIERATPPDEIVATYY